MAFQALDAEQEREVIAHHKAVLTNVFGRSKTWEFEKLLGNGTYGYTALIRNIDPLRIHRQKRMVLKRSLLMGDVVRDEMLITEASFLERMRGNMHHLQIIASVDEVAWYKKHPDQDNRPPRWWKRIYAAFKNPPENAIRAISNLDGPAVLLEYLENGDLLSLWMNMVDEGVEAPNRLLWRIYFCLIRACIGMAYPRNAPKGEPVKIETINENKPPGRFSHNDIAMRNIMIGDRTPKEAEHRVIPIFKLIDYGLATYRNTSYEAVTYNLWCVAKTMVWLICGPEATPEMGKQVLYRHYATVAHDLVWEDDFPNLDPDLRDIVTESMALEREVRPTLKQTFERVRRGVAKPAAAYGHRQLEESNYAIDAFLQQYLHSPPRQERGEEEEEGEEGEAEGEEYGEEEGEEYEEYDEEE
ncbi:hypothetical protein GGS20DRAFT_567327 [Poronia punctata]|nr:hypothetical protein GGS20DRAFT_567327 [Poronia punctata]